MSGEEGDGVVAGPGFHEGLEEGRLGAGGVAGGAGGPERGVGGLDLGAGGVAGGARLVEAGLGISEGVVCLGERGERVGAVGRGCLGEGRLLGLDALALDGQERPPVPGPVAGGLRLAERGLGLGVLLAGVVEGLALVVGGLTAGVALDLRLVEAFLGALGLGLGGGDAGVGLDGLGLDVPEAGDVGGALLLDSLQVATRGGPALGADADLGLQLLDRLGVGLERAGGLAHPPLLPDKCGAGLLEPGLALRHLRGQPLRLGAAVAEHRVEAVAFFLEAGDVVGGERQLQAAEPCCDTLVARGLLSLPRQRPDLLLDLLDDVVEAGEVGAGGVEAAEGLGAAALVLGDAGGLFEEPAAVVGVVGEDVLDHRQLDHGVGPGAHAGVHEQVEDVAEPAGGPVEEVLRVARAVEPAGDGNLGVLGREDAARVLDGQRHLGHAQRPFPRGAVEDDAAHGLAAEQARALLSQDPPDGVDDVRLAAPVRPHDRRHAGREVDGRLLGEALEPVEVEPAEVHAGAPRAPFVTPEDTRRAPGPEAVGPKEGRARGPTTAPAPRTPLRNTSVRRPPSSRPTRGLGKRVTRASQFTFPASGLGLVVPRGRRVLVDGLVAVFHAGVRFEGVVHLAADVGVARLGDARAVLDLRGGRRGVAVGVHRLGGVLVLLGRRGAVGRAVAVGVRGRLIGVHGGGE